MPLAMAPAGSPVSSGPVIFWVGFGQRQNHLVCAVYCDWGHRMATESLTNVVQSLTPQEQDAVLRFIDYLKGRDVSLCSGSPFLQAADEFIAKHPDLLQRLAQ